MSQQIEITKNYFIETYTHTDKTSLRHKPCKGTLPPEESGSSVIPSVDGGFCDEEIQQCLYCKHTFDPKILMTYKLWKWHNNR